MARRVFITVGEASGDQHAAHLIRELRILDPNVVVEGLGGDEMRAAGAIVHHDTVARAAMGWEAAFRYFELKRLLRWSKKYYEAQPPDLQICIDSWSMNWHWARLAREHGVPVLYYIAPQVWASRSGRVKKIAKYVNRVACILPFEETFYRERGVAANFVGHPLFDALQPSTRESNGKRFPDAPPVIGILPGSRSSVADKNFPQMLEVADLILKEFPQAKFLVPTMSATHEVVKEYLLKRPGTGQGVPLDGGHVETIGPFTFGMSGGNRNYFDDFVPKCDLCLTVSGTATLHTAVHDVPMIVVYRGSPILWHGFAKFFIHTRTFALVNLLTDDRRHIVPEFVPWYGSNVPVAEKALEYLREPKILEEQREELRGVVKKLSNPGASRNAASIAMELLYNGKGVAREI